jgi:hypothetical protein
MTKEECVKWLAYLVELRTPSKDQIDSAVLPYICGSGFRETYPRRMELLEAFRSTVSPSIARDRILDYLADLTKMPAK